MAGVSNSMKNHNANEYVNVKLPTISEVSLADVLRLGRDLGVKLEPEEVEEEEGNVGTEDDARTGQDQCDSSECLGEVDSDVRRGDVNMESAECSAGPGRDGSCSDRDTSADSTNYFADAETAEWFQSLAAQATVLAVEHEKMAEMLGLQRQFDLQESRLRSELESCRRDRLTTRRWRDQLLRDKLAEVEAATSEMKQLVSQLDEASPCWRNKVRFAEMF